MVSWAARGPISWLSPEELVDLRQDTRSRAFMNWCERRQADHLVELFGSLPADSKLMVWCGWSHHSKMAMPGPEGLKPMGRWFGRRRILRHRPDTDRRVDA